MRAKGKRVVVFEKVRSVEWKKKRSRKKRIKGGRITSPGMANISCYTVDPGKSTIKRSGRPTYPLNSKNYSAARMLPSHHRNPLSLRENSPTTLAIRHFSLSPSPSARRSHPLRIFAVARDFLYITSTVLLYGSRRLRGVPAPRDETFAEMKRRESGFTCQILHIKRVPLLLTLLDLRSTALTDR